MYAEADAAGLATGDQYLAEFVVADRDGRPVGTMSSGDAVLLYNFRGDRSIEISRAYEEPDFDVFDRGEHPDVYFAGMLQYDGDALVPKQYLVEPPAIDRTISEYLCAEGVRSFAVSETQKFGHVTYFWNGNRSGYIDRVARDIHRDAQRQRRVRHDAGHEGPRDHRRSDRPAAHRRVPLRPAQLPERRHGRPHRQSRCDRRGDDGDRRVHGRADGGHRRARRAARSTPPITAMPT